MKKRLTQLVANRGYRGAIFSENGHEQRMFRVKAASAAKPNDKWKLAEINTKTNTSLNKLEIEIPIT